jgi:hypothetical protein
VFGPFQLRRTKENSILQFQSRLRLGAKSKGANTRAQKRRTRGKA